MCDVFWFSRRCPGVGWHCWHFSTYAVFVVIQPNVIFRDCNCFPRYSACYSVFPVTIGYIWVQKIQFHYFLTFGLSVSVNKKTFVNYICPNTVLQLIYRSCQYVRRQYITCDVSDEEYFGKDWRGNSYGRICCFPRYSPVGTDEYYVKIQCNHIL